MVSRSVGTGFSAGGRRSLWAVGLAAGLVGLWSAGCGKKLDCDAFSKKAEGCSVELYLALSGPETAFVERMVSDEGGLSPEARRSLEDAWRAERKRLAGKLVERLSSKCRKDKGRYAQSEDLQKCLSRASCKDFAACVAKALGVEHEAGADKGPKPSAPKARPAEAREPAGAREPAEAREPAGNARRLQ